MTDNPTRNVAEFSDKLCIIHFENSVRGLCLIKFNIYVDLLNLS